MCGWSQNTDKQTLPLFSFIFHLYLALSKNSVISAFSRGIFLNHFHQKMAFCGFMPDLPQFLQKKSKRSGKYDHFGREKG
jgi:hypothetical protein